MTNNRKVPVVRFKGFEEAWEEKKLEELAQFNPKAELPDVFQYVDLESVRGTTLISHRTELKKNAPSRAQRLARKGDLFYQTVRPYQKNNFLFELPYENYVFSTGYAQLRPFIIGNFLFNIVQNESFIRDVLDRCTGTSYPAINPSILAQLKVFVSNNSSEQTKIGNYFKYLDSLIHWQGQKLQKVKNLKKAMFEKMFPRDNSDFPEIRFTGFTEKWEKKELGKILVERKKLQRITPDTPILAFAAGQGVIDRSQRKSNNRDHLTLDPISKVYLLTEYDDIVYNPSNLKYGAIDRNKHGRGVISPIYITFTTEQDPSFLEQIVKSESFKIKALQFEEGTVVKRQSVKPENLLSLEVNISTSLKEQYKIGQYFQNLDQLISQSQQKLEQLNFLKQAMLQKMFI